MSLKTERKLRIFEDDAYLSLDLQQKILTVIRKRTAADAPGPLPVTIEEQSLEPGDALKAEIDSFLDCIRTGRAPVVSGEAGLVALRDRHAHHRAGRALARTQTPEAARTPEGRAAMSSRITAWAPRAAGESMSGA